MTNWQEGGYYGTIIRNNLNATHANGANANALASTAAGESGRRRGAAKMAPAETENTELLQPTTETHTATTPPVFTAPTSHSHCRMNSILSPSHEIKAATTHNSSK